MITRRPSVVLALALVAERHRRGQGMSSKPCYGKEFFVFINICLIFLGTKYASAVECYKGLCPTNYYYIPMPDGAGIVMPAPDSDGDGVPDNVEDYLLQRYSPYYLFSTESHGRVEDNNPTDPMIYVMQSQFCVNGYCTKYDNTSPDGSLNPMKIVRELGYDINKNPKRVGNGFDPWNGTYEYCTGGSSPGGGGGSGDPGGVSNPINVRSADIQESCVNGRKGEQNWDLIKIKGNIGLFGHVVPFPCYPPPFACYKGYYKIEYWQFFGINDADQEYGVANHEGDWTTIQLVVHINDLSDNNPADELIESVTHFMHGDWVIFNVPDATEAIVTAHRENVYGSIDIRYLEYRGINHAEYPDGIRGRVSEDRVRFFPDPWDGKYTHPIVYIEWGAHEFWPTEVGNICILVACSPAHNGDDLYRRYLTKDIPNLGEVESKNMPSDEVELILKFNGNWGAEGPEVPPPGPALHKSWMWPEGSKLRSLVEKYLE